MTRTVAAILLATLLAAVPTVGRADNASFGFDLKRVSPGTEIPEVEMSLGMRPFANDLIFVSGIKQGFYRDVGIRITPPPYGRKVLPDQAIPLLINKELDVMALYPPDVVAALDTVKSIRFIALSDLFQGFAILANPQSGAKTVGQFMEGA